MEVLATEGFLERVRHSPALVREHLAAVAIHANAGAPCATELADQRVLGWSARGAEVALWFLLRPEEAARRAAESPFLSLSKAELLGLGVCESALPQVRRVQSSTDLAALGLPETVAQRLRFVFIQRTNGLRVRDDDLRFRSPDLRHFDRFLHGDLTQLFLNLDPAQRRIAHLGGFGTIVVRGVAGSGKTAVALHRIYAHLHQRSLLEAPRVLFLTYNRALTSVALELLVSMGLRAGDVEVSTVHRWCWSYAASGGRVFHSNQLQNEVIRQAREHAWNTANDVSRNSAVWAYPLAFWAEEIHRIKGHGVAAEDYARFHRHGAGRPLDPRLRPLVWNVYEAYLRLQQEAALLDWDDVVRLAAERLRAEGSAVPRYDHVVVDEAQDLTVAALRVAAALCGPRGTLLVSYDPAQSIYEKGFRWKSVGIDVHGSRSFALRRNYRNTAEIMAAARPLLANMHDRLETGETVLAEDVLEPEQAKRHGVPPEFLAVPRGAECASVAARVADLITEEAVPPQNIAILCYPNVIRDRMCKALENAGILFQHHGEGVSIRMTDPSVKVLPLKSSKGLEFPVVFLLASGADFLPPIEGEAESMAWNEQMGRCFYMAMTRAMSRLVVVFAEGDLARFLGSAVPSVVSPRLPK